MKKSVALLLSLMLIMSLQPVFASGLIFTPVEDAPAATAEASLETETITLDCGLTFPAPVEWSDGPLPESFQVENQLYARYDGDGRFMQLRTNEYGKNATVEDMAKLFANEDSFTNVKVTENPLGQKLVYLEAATGNFLSLMVFDGEGTAYICTFGNFYKGNPVVKDPVFMGLVETVKQNILLAPADDAAQPAASGIEYEYHTVKGAFTIPAPKGWELDLKKETDLFRATDPESGVYFYVRVNTYDRPGDPEGIYQSFAKADTMKNAQLLTGKDGLQIIQADGADGTFSALMIPDEVGNVYIITFTIKGNTQIQDNETLLAVRSFIVSEFTLN